MLYIHENNLQNKIQGNYGSIGDKINDFYKNIYLPTKEKLIHFDFSKEDTSVFEEATKVINDYYYQLNQFVHENPVTSQSKFRSTFLEELSCYLFQDNEYIKNGTLGIFNKNIYAGMKIGNDLKVDTITKDVDFCIGKKTIITVENQEIEIILPVVAVEVKTYLDATMLGEAQFSSKLIKNATPNVKTYILMETNRVKADKIIATRYDNVLNEMFVLRKKEGSLIDSAVLKDYYQQITNDISDIAIERTVITPGRLIHIKNILN